MSDDDFKNHVEALAVKKLEKPKKLTTECARHWKEIFMRQYNFDRGEESYFFLNKFVIFF